MTETWKSIDGWAGLYEISNLGRVKSLHPGNRIRKNGDGILGGGINKGYHFVCLASKERRCQIFVHNLVMTHFVGKKPSLHEINHKNGIRNDNRLENLEYVTRSQNIRHALDFVNGAKNMPRGTAHHWSKLNEDTVRAMRVDSETMTYAQLRKKYPMFSHGTIWSAVTRKTWKHIS